LSLSDVDDPLLVVHIPDPSQDCSKFLQKHGRVLSVRGSAGKDDLYEAAGGFSCFAMDIYNAGAALNPVAVAGLGAAIDLTKLRLQRSIERVYQRDALEVFKRDGHSLKPAIDPVVTSDHLSFTRHAIAMKHLYCQRLPLPEENLFTAEESLFGESLRELEGAYIALPIAQERLRRKPSCKLDGPLIEPSRRPRAFSVKAFVNLMAHSSNLRLAAARMRGSLINVWRKYNWSP